MHACMHGYAMLCYARLCTPIQDDLAWEWSHAARSSATWRLHFVIRPHLMCVRACARVCACMHAMHARMHACYVGICRHFYFFVVAHRVRKTQSPPEQGKPDATRRHHPTKKEKKEKVSGVAPQLPPEVLQSSSREDRAAATRGCTAPPDHHSREWRATGGWRRGRQTTDDDSPKDPRQGGLVTPRTPMLPHCTSTGTPGPRAAYVQKHRLAHPWGDLDLVPCPMVVP